MSNILRISLFIYTIEMIGRSIVLLGIEYFNISHKCAETDIAVSSENESVYIRLEFMDAMRPKF